MHRIALGPALLVLLLLSLTDASAAPSALLTHPGSGISPTLAGSTPGAFTVGSLDPGPVTEGIRDRSALLARIDSMIRAEMGRAPWAGLSVAVQKDGVLLFARGYGMADLEHGVPVNPGTVFRLGSVTKQFTSTAILQLMEDGKLSPDDEITRFLPEYPAEGRTVTVHHLLTHTSGIRSYTSMGPAFWEKSRLDMTHEEMLDLFASEPFDFEPGEEYRYNNSGYYLLGMIIEEVSETSYPEYLEEHVLGPAGLLQTSYCDQRAIVPHRAEGYSRSPEGGLANAEYLSMAPPGAAGALCSTTLDLLKWQAALDSGLLLEPSSRELQLTEATVNDGSGIGYGYGLSLGELQGHRKVAHGGGINGFAAMLATYPDDDLTVVVLGNTEGGLSGRIEENVARMVLGLELDPVLDLPVPASERERLTGEWRFPDIGLTARIYQEGEDLFFGIPGQPPSRLLSQGENVFFMADNVNQVLVFPGGPAPAETVELRVGSATYAGERVEG
jgi:CubicO group peptidase (beta-lactamase class C family)